MLCDLFLYAFVVPLLPSFLRDRAHVPPQDIQSAVSLTLAVYAFCASAGSPIAGLLADRLSQRSVPFLGGLVFLAAGTVIFMTVRTFPLLMVARALQGFSTAVVWTVGLAMLLDRVGAAAMGVTMGAIFGVIGAAQLLSPALGGWLYEKAGIEAVAGIALGAVALDCIMRLAVIETTDQVDDMNNGGATTSHPSTDAEPQDHEQTPLVTSDRSPTKQDMYPLPKYLPSSTSLFPIIVLIQDPRLLSAYVLQFTQSLQLSAIDATLPSELNPRLGFSSGPMSLLILPLVLPFIVCNPIFGRLVDRIGPKAPAHAGLCGWTIVLCLLRIPPLLLQDNRRLGIGVWAGLLVLNGISAAAVGSGGIVAAGKVAEGYLSEHPDMMVRKGGKGPFAQLFSINSIVYNGGLAVGPVAAGALRVSIGYANMNIVLAVQLLATVVICYVYMDGWPVCGRGYEATDTEE